MLLEKVLTDWYKIDSSDYPRLSTQQTNTSRIYNIHVRRSLNKVPGIHWYNLQELLHGGNLCLISWQHSFLTPLQKQFRHFITSDDTTADICCFDVREVVSVIEQRVNFRFCVLLQKSRAETLTVWQQAYGDREWKTLSTNASMMDARVLTKIRVVVAHQL